MNCPKCFEFCKLKDREEYIMHGDYSHSTKRLYCQECGFNFGENGFKNQLNAIEDKDPFGTRAAQKAALNSSNIPPGYDIDLL